MAGYPPAAPPPPPPPGGAPSARPGIVTAAGVLLIIGGALVILFSFIFFAAGGGFVILGILFLAVGAVELYAGIQVLGLKERGRQIGILLAGIGIVLNLISIVKAPVSSVISIAIDGFIIYALTQNASSFTA